MTTKSKSGDSNVLLALAQAGDRTALGELFQRTRPQLMAQAKSLIPQKLQKKLGASDLVQKTFEEATRDFDQFRSGKALEFRRWLSRLLVNNAKDAKKEFDGTGKRDLKKERDLDHPSRVMIRELAKDSSSTLAALETEEELLQMREAILKLPPPDQKLLELFCLGYSHVEIANRFNKSVQHSDERRSPDAVRMQWIRIVDRIRKLLGSKQ